MMPPIFRRPLVFLLLALLFLSLPAPSSAPGDEAKARKPVAGAADKNPEAANKERKDDEEYYDLLRMFVDTLDQVDRNYVTDTSRRELVEAAIRGMLSKLDPYSTYIPPDVIDQFRSGVENEFEGIGIRIGMRGGKLTIISPLVGTPAYRAGLMAGDQIVRIEGEDADGMTIDEARDRLKGKLGTRVRFTVRHPGSDETETVTLTREVVHVPTVLGWRRQKDDSWSFLLDPKRRIGYIRITAFGRRTAEELRDALEQLTKRRMRALVLDLRFNPGGLLASAIEVCDLFITKGRIVSTQGRNTPTHSWSAHRAGSFVGFPMAILVNRYSASASEIVAACLQDHRRAAIVGERTWGKGSVQNLIELEGGHSALKLTTASYRRPSGKNIHRFPGASEKDDWGVRPDPGMEVRMSNSELTQLHRDERRREVLRSAEHAPPAETQETDAAPFTDRQLNKALERLQSELGEAEEGAGERGKGEIEEETAPATRPNTPAESPS